MKNRFAVSILFSKRDQFGSSLRLRSKIQEANNHDEALGLAIQDLSKRPDVTDCSIDTYTVLIIEDATERTDNTHR